MLEDIIQSHQQGHLEQAEAGYRKHLNTQPDDHRALFLLALLLDMREQHEEALDLLNRAVSLAPDQADYLLAVAQIQLGRGQFAGARASVSAALKLNPNAASGYLLLGRLAWREGHIEEAQRQVKWALRCNPDAPEALLFSANLALEEGSHEEALRMLSPLAQKFPQDPAIQASLGQAFLASGTLAFAEQALRNAVTLAPKAVLARVGLAEVLLRQARYQEARELLTAALADDPDNRTVQVRLGDACRAGGDFSAAIEAYAPLATVLANHPDFTVAYADALARSGRGTEARERLDLVLVSHPQHPIAWQVRAQVERLAGDRAALESVVRRWLGALPDDPGALETLALLGEAERPEEAEALADRVIAAQPGGVAARLLKTRALLARGEANTAVNALETALVHAENPNAKGVLHGTLGALCHRLGDRRRALDHWHEVHRLAGGRFPLPMLSRVSKLPDPPAPLSTSTAGVLRPIFLVAPPGCGGEQAAGLLQDLGLPLLGDRFFAPLARRHGFVEYEADAWYPEPDDAKVSAFADGYREAMARAGVGPDRPYVDWLPGFDAAWLPILVRALPGARWVVAMRDRRDALLYWLATGSFYPSPLVDLHDAALWMAVACDHAECAARIPGAVRLDIDALAAGEDIPDVLLELVGVSRPITTPLFASAAPRTAGDGLPLDFDAGVWRHYDELLAAPFQAVQSPAS